VRKPGLEPGRIAPLAPKASASTSSATFACPKDITISNLTRVLRDKFVTILVKDFYFVKNKSLLFFRVEIWGIFFPANCPIFPNPENT
jgi:hypothetical protein